MNSTNPFRLESYSVSELNQYIASLLEQDLFLKHIQVSGEISGMKVYHSSGHGYFTLKDENSSISCVIFSRWLKNLSIVPQDGMQVWVQGAVSVYTKQGRYQLYVENIVPVGLGEYYLRLENLKQKLYEEGLFDLEKKRPLPVRASKIGIVTSLYGAALRDMVRILRLRQPGIEVVVVHSLVQGPEAPASLCQGIARLNQYGKVDVIILGRGGGSAEDLKAFNEEEVVRAVHKSKIPVIAAIGHEVDYSLTDLAADVRAATPTQAAQLAVPEDEKLLQQIHAYQRILRERMLRKIHQTQMELDAEIAFMQEYIRKWILEQRKQCYLRDVQRFQRAMQSFWNRAKSKSERETLRLEALNPRKILQRGYACVLRGEEYLYQAASVQENECLWVQMQDGKLLVQVMKKEIHEKG